MIIKNINIDKLHTEFNKKKIFPTLVLVLEHNVGDFSFALNTDMDLVQQIIDAHDPTPIPPPLSETEKIRLEMARSNAEMFEMMVSMMGGGM